METKKSTTQQMTQIPWKRYIRKGMIGVIIFFIAIQFVPPGEVIEDNPFLMINDVQIIAHSGGKGHNPEETMKALKESVEQYHTDTLEFDLQITKDNRLVLIHDETINETGILEGSTAFSTPTYVKDLTLAELESYNFGVNFQASDGTYPYRDLSNYQFHTLGLDIVTIEEVFTYFETVQTTNEYRYIIEIKNEGTLGLKAADILVPLLETYELLDRVIVASFHSEVGKYITGRYPLVMRSAFYDEILAFLIATYTGTDSFMLPHPIAFQLPVSQNLGTLTIDLTTPYFIYRAHKHSISMQYWTINDEETMRDLIKKGVDGIMTDYPQVLYDLLVEMGIR